jgi:hypothetical protein
MTEETTKELAVIPETEGNDIVMHSGNIVSEDAFQMTLEQANRQIGKELAMYELVHEVAEKLLKSDDKYYMSQLNNDNWKEPKKGELPVLKKRAVDKLLSFFKIGMFPEVKKIDGGYEVTVVGRDRNGGYIGTGKGICTRYEKKFAWIKASDDEYAAANEEDRRIVKREYKGRKYDNKQIKTDERSMAHTLTSMAEKRARAAFIRKLMPGLDSVSFEGEEYQGDYKFEDDQKEPSPSDQVMTETEITDFYKGLKDQYKVDNIKEAFREITGDEKLGGTTHGQSLDINTYLKDNYGDQG